MPLPFFFVCVCCVCVCVFLSHSAASSAASNQFLLISHALLKQSNRFKDRGDCLDSIGIIFEGISLRPTDTQRRFSFIILSFEKKIQFKFFEKFELKKKFVKTSIFEHFCLKYLKF